MTYFHSKGLLNYHICAHLLLLYTTCERSPQHDPIELAMSPFYKWRRYESLRR